MSVSLTYFACFTFTFIISVVAQSDLQSCSKVCRRLQGQCNVSLFELARTPCLDTKTQSARTCDCDLDMDKLQSLGSKDVVRDCVIPRPLSNSNSAVDIKPKFTNVHAASISNFGSLKQSGNILRSTICEWKCVGGSRFQNCVLAGSVTRSKIGSLNAAEEASLDISGLKFNKNTAGNIRSNKDFTIGNKDGFDANTVQLVNPSSRRLFTVAGTSITNNRFNQITVGAISSFANVDGNSASIASAEGPCVVPQVKSPITVDDFLRLPEGDIGCERLFQKA